MPLGYDLKRNNERSVIDLRIDKMLANMGYGSRKEVKKLLKDGGLQVNGEVIKDGKAI